MYVTRPLSSLQRSPQSVSAPPDGPNSGYLVIQDEESVKYSCFGLCKDRSLKELPFPQDKELIAQHVRSTGESVDVSRYAVYLTPVLNQPLSSNRYYAVASHGKHKGKAVVCSREEDKTTCCFCRLIKDVKPKPLDPQNIYQQLEIVPRQPCCNIKGSFVAKSIASDGFPPYLLRQGWSIYRKTPKTFKLDSAPGLDSKLRAHFPESYGSCVVGKWYTPFMFVKEETVQYQVKRSMYYELTLEQRWEKIFSCRKNAYENSVVVDSTFEKEQVFIGGKKATWNESSVVEGVMWFTTNDPRGNSASVGLRVELAERMKWEQKRGGFIDGGEREVKINRVEEFKGEGDWNEFGCYVLAERFDLKRMDGSLLLSYDFKHFHQMKTKWE